MKVICINAGMIDFGGYYSKGDRLVQGMIYTAIDETNNTVTGQECYIIQELLNEVRSDGETSGQKLKSRFRIIETQWIDELLERLTEEEPQYA